MPLRNGLVNYQLKWFLVTQYHLLTLEESKTMLVLFFIIGVALGIGIGIFYSKYDIVKNDQVSNKNKSK